MKINLVVLTNNSYVSIANSYIKYFNKFNIEYNYCTSIIERNNLSADLDIIIVKYSNYKIVEEQVIRKTIIEDISDSCSFFSLKLLENKNVIKYNKLSLLKKEYINNSDYNLHLKYRNIKNISNEQIEIFNNYYYKFNNLFDFGLIRKMDYFNNIIPIKYRKYDVVFIGTPTSEVHRRNLEQKISEIKGLNIFFKLLNKDERMTYTMYSTIMNNSKICISPWGYGDTCFRDFEAFASKSILIKPNTEFSKINRNAFIPNKTVFWCNSDWSNLKDVIDYSLNEFNQDIFEKENIYIKKKNDYDYIFNEMNNLFSLIKKI